MLFAHFPEYRGKLEFQKLKSKNVDNLHSVASFALKRKKQRVTVAFSYQVHRYFTATVPAPGLLGSDEP